LALLVRRPPARRPSPRGLAAGRSGEISVQFACALEKRWRPRAKAKVNEAKP
jgi:hypothetical protein